MILEAALRMRLNRLLQWSLSLSGRLAGMPTLVSPVFWMLWLQEKVIRERFYTRSCQRTIAKAAPATTIRMTTTFAIKASGLLSQRFLEGLTGKMPHSSL
jgi:hypothetical protein